MIPPLIFDHWEDTNLVVMSRVLDADQTAIVQADIASIAMKVFDESGTQIGTTEALTVASVIFDTLQTDYGWSTNVDSTGYNFRTTVTGATYFPTGGVRVRIEVIGTAAAGGTFPLGVWEPRVVNLFSS